MYGGIGRSASSLHRDYTDSKYTLFPQSDAGILFDNLCSGGRHLLFYRCIERRGIYVVTINVDRGKKWTLRPSLHLQKTDRPCEKWAGYFLLQ